MGKSFFPNYPVLESQKSNLRFIIRENIAKPALPASRTGMDFDRMLKDILMYIN